MNTLKNPRVFIIYGVLLFLAMAFMIWQFTSGFNTRQTADVLSTSDFVTAVKEDRVIDVTYKASTAALSGTYLPEGVTDTSKAVPFTSTYIGDDSLNTLMQAHRDTTNFHVDTSNSGMLQQIFFTVITIVLLGLLLWFMFRQFNSANNKQMQFGRSKARKAHEERPTTKFKDVAGIDEVVEELQEVKDFLSNPTRFQELGAKIPRGVLLVGPPGTGKTLLARAVAGEAGTPFFSISGSDFVEMFVGVGASRVRDLFEQAKSAAPSIIFIDEIDAVGRQRGAGLGGGHDEREQTLNQLLVEMDGFDDHQSVILIAATNRVDILDPALLRPGRFDRQIIVMRPDLKGREAILKVHSEGKPLAHSVDLTKLARMTAGFTGADLANLMNEAALLTARRGKKLITEAELGEAMEREIAGPERKSRIMTEQEKRTIAFHEAGHALVGHVLEHSDPVHKISIISRGQALGYTLSLPSEDRFLNSRKQMLDDLSVFLGGRVAEEIFCDDITTGASNDLERATHMARQMVTRYGMTDALGIQVYGQAEHEVFLGRDYASTPDYSDATARKIDEEVARIMHAAHEIAQRVLHERSDQMRLMVQVLLERETVESEALDALLNNTWPEYIAGEEALLAEKARKLKEQEEDDARRAAEAKQREEAERAMALAQAQAAGIPLSNTPGHKPGNKQQPGSPPQTPTLREIFSGKVDLEEMMRQYRGEQPKTPDQQPGAPEQLPPVPPVVEQPPVPQPPVVGQTPVVPTVEGQPPVVPTVEGQTPVVPTVEGQPPVVPTVVEQPPVAPSAGQQPPTVLQTPVAQSAGQQPVVPPTVPPFVGQPVVPPTVPSVALSQPTMPPAVEPFMQPFETGLPTLPGAPSTPEAQSPAGVPNGAAQAPQSAAQAPQSAVPFTVFDGSATQQPAPAAASPAAASPAAASPAATATATAPTPPPPPSASPVNYPVEPSYASELVDLSPQEFTLNVPGLPLDSSAVTPAFKNTGAQTQITGGSPVVPDLASGGTGPDGNTGLDGQQPYFGDPQTGAPDDGLQARLEADISPGIHIEDFRPQANVIANPAASEQQAFSLDGQEQQQDSSTAENTETAVTGNDSQPREDGQD